MRARAANVIALALLGLLALACVQQGAEGSARALKQTLTPGQLSPASADLLVAAALADDPTITKMSAPHDLAPTAAAAGLA